MINFFGGENRFTQGNKLSDCSGIWAHNHLVTNRTHNHLAELTKWFSCVVSTYLYDAFGCVILSCHILILEWIHTLQLPDYQEIACSNKARYRNCNGIGTYDHLACKRTINHLSKLAKWLSCVVSIYMYDAFDSVFSSCHIRILDRVT